MSDRRRAPPPECNLAAPVGTSWDEWERQEQIRRGAEQRKRRRELVVGVGILLVLAGAGYLVNETWHPFDPVPSACVERANAHLERAESAGNATERQAEADLAWTYLMMEATKNCQVSS